ncbi:undecaprenyldiphospho-muramoylpentapeptide beta-N-acetylglucosaminyltransferase [Carboxylicivirga caseinilyticus]|uniref:undecaprenyldiphospho-muramoylpentapeptide beta-N-acetylglucosaminyltransferase n=1 Tax=Carboxylicivirga caseinilyticus TaxID=3417572 RepID=UPI003D34CDC8|nr:undecaprenyldiphospho-muramoylpentapeptide beta-N-acetylglucosaminyltransferase [Marinilabiliaceae bacterium A049]
MSELKVIISGGGTGGHIFPAISIANAVKEQLPDAKILFVGAQGKMEMEKVPEAGYEIVGLPVAGLQRKVTLKNLSFPLKLIKSLAKARSVVKEFNPDVAVGVGGYASGPVLRVASQKGIPCLLQEQNSFPGVTNRILARKAAKICVAYDKMDRFFEAQKIILTGNPVRSNLIASVDRKEAAEFWKLDPDKKTILVIGGSLGARSVNNGILHGIDQLPEECQLIWQTGKFYFEEMKAGLPEELKGRVIVTDFISRMDMAFAMADVVVSRAGAGTISELAILGKPTIFVPSPNVSEDHQTKNAMALVEKDAAMIVKDSQVKGIIHEASQLALDEHLISNLAENIKKLAKPDAAKDIAKEVIKLGKSKK